MEAAMSKSLPVAWIFLAIILAGAGRANAETPAAIAGSYEAAARAASPAFAGFSAARGEQLFQSTHGGEWSCSTCHTTNPLGAGKHAKTGKPIAPLAPAANTERFTSLATTEKWFKRNCNDVIGRLCTAQEKGDVLTYLMQQKR
jgi:mono/diheme cytochrome c family protein